MIGEITVRTLNNDVLGVLFCDMILQQCCLTAHIMSCSTGRSVSQMFAFVSSRHDRGQD
jgi:hypothetical protein